MSISVKCPCGAVHEMPDSWAGKRGKCSNCGRLLAVPFPSARPRENVPPQPQPPPAPAEPPKPAPSEEFVPFEMEEVDDAAFEEGAKKKEEESRKEEPPPPDVHVEGNIISFKCSCGKLLKAPLDKAGKTAKCPVCKKPISVPAPPEKKPEKEPESTFEYVSEEDIEILECPNCGAHMEKGAILCVQCGTNRVSGEKVDTKIGDDAFAGERKGLKDVLGKVAFWKKKKEE
ncbi:MAG: hypothetical protein V2A58_03305 [Planctomycetota bacterium]